eukprot:TRINITY_DN12556_c0_g1_i2.p1 TRINITY_DN12556_c0_g1~~TRINITY_DN12556_c0_g1_i2.p1  ORF type:complete len:151 (+),score=0.98 TRINITY_DN12556_c0_g1_i2:248-700(+)
MQRLSVAGLLLVLLALAVTSDCVRGADDKIGTTDSANQVTTTIVQPSTSGGVSASVVEVVRSSHRRELKRVKRAASGSGCGEGTGVCQYSGNPGCSPASVYCGGACCIDNHEYPCCGGVMCCKAGGCYKNSHGNWSCCPIGKKACGTKCC